MKNLKTLWKHRKELWYVISGGQDRDIQRYIDKYGVQKFLEVGKKSFGDPMYFKRELKS